MFELAESRARIEAITGREVVALAYPFGAFDEAVRGAAREVYRFALSTIHGWHYTQEHCDFAMRRLRVSRGTSLQAFVGMLGD